MSCLLFLSCRHATPPPQSNAVPVNLLTVTARPVVYYEKYPSTTVALSQVDLLPQVQGYITGIFFKEGSHVTKGQRLYEIDRRTYEANYGTALANLRVSEGNLEQSQQDADRYTYLMNNKAVAKQLYDHAIIALKNAQNAMQAAAESVKNARINLNFSEIKAPFDGTIGFSQVKLGNLVSVGQTVLNTVSTDNPMGVDFLINEKQLVWFRNLQKKGAHSSVDSLFTLLLPNNALYSYLGQISVLDRAVNPQTGALRIRLVFPNPDYSLKAGMSCVIRVHNQDATPQLVIPYKAIVEQMGEYFVYVAKDTSMPVGGKQEKQARTIKQGLFALQKKVKLGEVIEPDVIIKSGIREGDRIVVDGVQSLHDGSQITTENKRPPEQGKGR